jgi:o-succinylbenzoate synthase
LTRVELYQLEIPFRAPVRTAAGSHRRRPVGFVRVVAGDVEGWGECVALAEPTSVDAPFGSVWEELTDRGVGRLVRAAMARAGELPHAAQVASLFATDAVARPVAAAFEMAVLDAELRASGRPLWAHLGASVLAAEGGVPVGELVGIPADRQVVTLVEEVTGACERGAARIRLKIEPGWDVVPLQAVRTAFPDLALQADANGAYLLGTGGSDTALRLRALDGLGLVCVEQPLPPADLPSLAELAGELSTPVCLDESLTSPRRLADALRYGACEVACLKPARLGGLLAARRAHHICREAGIPAFVGGFFETGFARLANAALAGLPGFVLPGDLSDPGQYLTANPVPYPDTSSGRVRPWPGPGVGPPLADLVVPVSLRVGAWEADGSRHD